MREVELVGTGLLGLIDQLYRRVIFRSAPFDLFHHDRFASAVAKTLADNAPPSEMRTRSRNAKAEMRDHRVEIAVRMQEPMAALDAERADDHIDSLVRGHAAVP